ncbi:MAG TPA: chaperone NapD [Burkholderiales bacterium]
MLTRRQVLGGPPVEIASLIVHSLPGRRDGLRERLVELPGVEIHRRRR